MDYLINYIYELINGYTKFKVRLINPNAIIPQKADHGCAGYDVYSVVATMVPPGTRKLIPTGIKTEISRNHYLRVAPRSGLSVKGIDIGAGVIDSSYRGEIKVLVINNSDTCFSIEQGAKIAQLVLERCNNPKIEVVDVLSETVRGNGGFGSSGY
jgi:dUTP pyrophosphatase